ncbi:MAG: permease-like cell division protein FtsX [Candidatus Pacebacteria bacterium]|nr:permease-like cell division protein FtsX [Candidatus Paceibacterota bacterium]
MLWLNIKRVFRSGLQSFFRNGFVSLSSILVMSITLFIMSSMIFLGGFLEYSLNKVKEKVDVNVYFLISASEEDIFSVRKSLESLPEVSSVEYISREKALLDFKEKHKDDELTLQAIDELGENPLGASLNIKAKEPSQYAGIAKFLDNDSNLLLKDGTKIIDKVNYYQNKIIIDRLSSIIKSANTIGIWLALIFIIISILITFNTIKLVIFISKDEIAVMRLVGASSKYVKGPFVVSGILCGLISSFIILIISAIFAFFVGKYYGSYFSGFDLFDYFIINLLKIVVVIVGSGVIFGSLASYMAVHKYLKD